jgi:uncharacterized protein (TIGR02271 family)
MDWSEACDGGVTQPGVWEIDTGWSVYDADGEKVGDVEEVHPQHIVVGKGLFFHTERHIPVSAIANVDRERVVLNVGSREIDVQRWDQTPDLAGAGTGEEWDNDALSVPVVEEVIEVDTRDVDRGSARLRKDVTIEKMSVDVPLREEEVRVERRPAIHDYGTGEIPADAFQEMVIEIPIRGEEVEVSKRPVVREHVEVRKVVRERHRTVSEPVHRERVRVDGDNVAGAGDGEQARVS